MQKRQMGESGYFCRKRDACDLSIVKLQLRTSIFLITNRPSTSLPATNIVDMYNILLT